MAVEKQRAPSYPWYPRDFESDEEVKLMDYEAEGIYRRLLDHQWLHGGIPSDVDLIARLVPKIPAAKFRKLWPSMAGKFVVQELRLVNQKLERVRQEKDAFHDQKREAGRLSAAARKERDGSAQPNAKPNEPPNGVRTPVRTDRPTSPEPSSAFAFADDVKNTSSPPPFERRQVPERRTSGRIFLHRWQIEALIESLGRHAADFDLDVWIDQLASTADAQGLTFPTKEIRWEWVQKALAEEISKRGLPIAGATVGPIRPRGCKHVPVCADDATHTERSMADRKALAS